MAKRKNTQEPHADNRGLYIDLATKALGSGWAQELVRLGAIKKTRAKLIETRSAAPTVGEFDALLGVCRAMRYEEDPKELLSKAAERIIELEERVRALLSEHKTRAENAATREIARVLRSRAHGDPFDVSLDGWTLDSIRYRRLTDTLEQTLMNGVTEALWLALNDGCEVLTHIEDDGGIDVGVQIPLAAEFEGPIYWVSFDAIKEQLLTHDPSEREKIAAVFEEAAKKLREVQPWESAESTPTG